MAQSPRTRDVILTRHKFAAFVLALFAMAACGSEAEATQSPWISPSDEPTPTPAVSTSGEGTRVVVHLSPVDGEGQIGTATLTSDGVTTTVEIDVGPITGDAQPIHIHVGTCEDVGSVLHSLQNVVNGKSTTTVNRPLEKILAADTLVNVHASYADASNYTACAQLPSS